MNGDLPIFPDKWNVVQLRRKLCGVDGIRIGPFGSALTLDQMVEEGFKVYGQENVIAQDFTAGTRFLSPAKYSELKACSISSGDLLVTMMGTTGRCCVVPEGIAEGIMDSHLIRLRFKNREVDSSFMALLVDKGHYVKEQIASNGKGTIMSGLNSTIIKDVWVGLPDLKGQRIISKYLDEQTAKVDRLMDMRRRQIDLLKEQRAALIQQAVTRGLNPDAPMKDSGIPWLGEIPAHWDVKRLKYLCSLLRDGTHQPPKRVETGYPLLSVRNIVENEFILRDDDSMISAEDFATLNRSFSIKAGDLLLAIVGATLGKVAVVPEIEPFQIQRSLAILRSRPAFVNRDLLRYFISCSAFQKCLWRHVGFSAQPGIYLSTVGNLSCPVPSLNEQEEILEYIQSESIKIDKIISTYTRQLTLLAEYRSSLIHECVTGQRLLNNPSMANGENNEHKSRSEANQ